MQLYSMEGLPLQKYKNKYVIHSNELSEWMVYKEQEEKKRQRQMLISNCIGILIVLIMIMGLLGVFFYTIYLYKIIINGGKLL